MVWDRPRDLVRERFGERGVMRTRSSPETRYLASDDDSIRVVGRWDGLGALDLGLGDLRSVPEGCVAVAPSELDLVDSMILGSPEEPAGLDATGSMTNDLRCCDGSNTILEGSRGGSASLPTHSTSPFQSPRCRTSVASSHVPHPRPCGPRSCWDRCTILHIRGAAGPQRRPSHRSAPSNASRKSKAIVEVDL